MNNSPENVAAFFDGLSADDRNDATVTRLLPEIYQQLRELAGRFLSGERQGHTLQATALVHEAYVRLAGDEGALWTDRAHFFRLAATTMRHILIDHARRRAAEKRGGGEPLMRLSETAVLFQENGDSILEIDDALQRLSALDSEKARVVELRYYGGCSINETAEALAISTATVERHWRFARAWLKAQLSDDV